jgi:4-amino-4-deoxy-L-arabinose transferase-like glycosyltransferase
MDFLLRLGRPALAALVLLSIGVHIVSVDQFGWFRDELYYLACGAHLAWGYVDHPPLVAVAAALVPGRSFLAVRALPILCGALTLVLAWRLAERMGANGFGRVLAALAALLTPTYLFQFHTLSMNAFEVVLWSAGALLALDLDEDANWNRWLGFGAVVGIGLLNKHSMLFWCSAMLVGLVATGRLRAFRTAKPWLAAGVAALLVAPHVYWQATHDFPTLEFYRNAGAQKILPMSPLGYLGGQLTLAGPGNVLLWLGGLVWLLFSRKARRFRFLGIAYLTLLASFILMKGKAYYLVPFYVVLFAAGGAAWEQTAGRLRRGLATVAVFAIVGVGCLTAPLAMPVLSPEATIAWSKKLGLAPPQAERAALAELPQHLADMFGWPELVASVAQVRDALPADERNHAQILVGNYGEAAAIDWLGPAYGLPPARAPHNAYFMWGPPRTTDGPVIVLGNRRIDEPRLHDYFERVSLVGRTRCRHCMPFERDLPVFLCRGFKRPAADIWPSLKFYF